MTTSAPLLSQAIDSFLLARTADGYSPKTLDQYEWALSRLVKRIGDKPVEELVVDDLRRFLVWLREEYKPERKKKLSDVSIFHAWKAIRAFYKWASPELEIPNVSLKISEPRHAYAEIVPFTEGDVKNLLNACNYKIVHTRGMPKQRRPTAIRDRAMVLVLLDTGMRVGELCRLNIENLNLEVGEIHIKPQGSGYKSKSRVLPIGSTTQRALHRYLAGREIEQQAPLFETIQGERINPREIQHFCRRLGERAGVLNCHPHRFRHTFAIMYLRNKGDVFSLQRILGHSTWEMINHYLSLAQADVKEAHRRAGPVDNLEL